MKATYPGGAADTYGYDTLGRRTSMANAVVSMSYTYDALNRVKSVTNQTYNLTISYDYDAAGNRTKMTTPASNQPVAYTYDAKNRLVTIEDKLLGTFRFGYDAMDRRTSLVYPNGITTSYAYDDAYRLTAMVAKRAAGTIVDAWSYEYDAVGNRTSKTDLDGKRESYGYDEVDRLTSAVYSDGTSEAFTYDPVGNRKTKSDGAGNVVTYSYDVANQLLTAGPESFTYDNNGSLVTKSAPRGTTTLTYDAANRVTQIADPAGNETSGYAPDGTRVKVNGPATEGRLMAVAYDLGGNPLLDYHVGWGLWIYRVYGPGIDEPLGEWRTYPNARATYLHHDALGSVTMVSDASSAAAYRTTYRAFGESTSTAGQRRGGDRVTSSIRDSEFGCHRG